ncbi:MAG: C69 family dipeptidase [Candidatus Sabulitectum sp.]|nr:C69 family dipeptidase [Candidatus Sabulitectum sp.]
MSKYLSLLWIVAGIAAACTTIIVTPGASEDGSMYVTHSDDNELSDQRLVFVPAADHEPGSMRSVYCSANALGEYPEYNSFQYPRMVCDERGSTYNTPDYASSIPLGEIPQVEHTYAYFDGGYGVMNEHQLMIGECTCGVKMQLDPLPGKRIFYSAELSRVALERCTTARDAVLLIGSLIEEYGYYGTGETLLLGDPEEAWVIEMCCGTSDSTGGLWVAQKVPDGEIFVAANEFRIRDVSDDESVFLHSSNLFDQCEALGWWSPADGEMDWLRAVSEGEYNHPYYSLRRVWRVMSFAAPSLELSPWVEDGFTRYYPFSIKPDQPLALRDVMRLHRDHYEGTQFDMTAGIAAGPFGYPYRFYGPADGSGDVNNPDRPLEGAWERPLSVNYCGYVYVNQGRSWLPDLIGGITWFGPDKPAETCFVPFYCGVSDLPDVYQTCNPGVYSRESAWWAFNFVANWAGVKYSYMRKDIEEIQEAIEVQEIGKIAISDMSALEIFNTSGADQCTVFITDFCKSNADSVVSEWWNFADLMIVKYDDGYINSPGHMAHEVGYPQQWLDEAGWHEGPLTYTNHQEN